MYISQKKNTSKNPTSQSKLKTKQIYHICNFKKKKLNILRPLEKKKINSCSNDVNYNILVLDISKYAVEHLPKQKKSK